MAIKTSKGKEAYFASYKSSGKFAKNRKAKLSRLLNKDPDNVQLQDALANVPAYRRKKPVTPTWSASAIRTAKLFKEFTGYFDPNTLSSNMKTAIQASKSARSRVDSVGFNKKALPKLEQASMFSLAARANWAK